MKKSIAIILSIIFVMTITFPAAALSTIAVKSIKLNNSKIILTVGQASNLVVTFTPANTSQKRLTYVTHDKYVATVDATGKIKAVHAGSTKITVYSPNKKIFAQCTVTILRDTPELKGTFELALFSNGEAMDAYWKEAINGFKAENPKLVVKSTITGSIGDVLRPRWVKNDVPDFAYLDGESVNNDMPTLLSEKRFEQLDDFVNTAKSWDDPEKLMKDTWASFDVRTDDDNKIIALPSAISTFGLFYSGKKARELGITKIPKNFEDFTALLDTIKKKGIAPIGYPGANAVGYLTNYWYDALVAVQDPQAYLDFSNLVPGAFQRPVLAKSYNMIKSLRKYEMEGSIGLKHTEVQMAWLQGQCFFYPCGSWIEAEMGQDVPADFDMKIAPFPMPKGSKNITFVQTSQNWFIPKDGKNKEAAKEFVRFLYQAKFARLYVELLKSNFIVPANLDRVNVSPMLSSVTKMLADPSLKSYKPKYGYGTMLITEYLPLGIWFLNNQMKYFTDQITAEQFYSNWQKEAEKLQKDPEFVKKEQKWIIAP